MVDVYHPENIKKIFDQSYENKITVKNIEWIGDDIIAAGSDSSSVFIANARNSNQYVLHGHRKVSTNRNAQESGAQLRIQLKISGSGIYQGQPTKNH